MGISTDDYRQLCRNLNLDPVETLRGGKKAKYGNTKKIIFGITFDSTGEANHFVALRTMEDAGLISGLELQPRFLLQEAFTDGQGKRHRKAEYVADFRYIENGKEIVEDFKGVETQTFRLKFKLAIERYPEVEFRLVKRASGGAR